MPTPKHPVLLLLHPSYTLPTMATTRLQPQSDYDRIICTEYNLLPSASNKLCARTLVKKSCLGTSCPCYTHSLSSIEFYDHPRRWIYQGGFSVITIEPYKDVLEEHIKEFPAFRTELTSIGIQFKFGHISPWSNTTGWPDIPIDSANSDTQLILLHSSNPTLNRNYSSMRATKFQKALLTSSK